MFFSRQCADLANSLSSKHLIKSPIPKWKGPCRELLKPACRKSVLFPCPWSKEQQTCSLWRCCTKAVLNFAWNLTSHSTYFQDPQFIICDRYLLLFILSLFFFSWALDQTVNSLSVSRITKNVISVQLLLFQWCCLNTRVIGFLTLSLNSFIRFCCLVKTKDLKA